MKKINFLIFIIITFGILKIDIVFAEDIYKEYKIGDEIIYNDIDFYVVADSDKTKDYVTLLKKTPLTVDEVNKYGKDENGLNYVNRFTNDSVGTAYDQNGYGGMAYYTSETCGYPKGTDKYNPVKSGCTTNYDKSDIKKVVDNWGEERLKLDDLVEDNLGYKIRLLSHNELITNLGYINSIDTGKTIASSNGVTPTFVFEYARYSTMSQYSDSDNCVWGVEPFGSLFINDLVFTTATVRPVINLRKEPIGVKKKLTDKEFKIGDIVEYNNMRFYVVDDSSKKDKTVTLLKDNPLTYDEVEKYGKGIVNLYAYKRYRNKVVDNKGYGGVAYYTTKSCGYLDENDNSEPVNNGCTTSYYKSDIKKVVDAWAIDAINEKDLAIDSLGYKARLLSMSDLNNIIEYKNDNGGTIHFDIKKLNGSYEWLTNVSSWYWTMTGWFDYTSKAWTVGSISLSARPVYQVGIDFDPYYTGGLIRPVITLKKQTEQNIDESNDVENNEKNNQIISVPDTFLTKPIIFVAIGAILIIIGIITGYIAIRKRKPKINK